jgi:hypothetical protein
MKNINNFTLYATCPSENGIQIRQARFLNFAINVIDIKFAHNGNALFASGYGNGKIEIAGLGTFTPYELMHESKRQLYYSFEGAKAQDKNQLVFAYDYFKYYTKQINLLPLEITRLDVCRAIETFAEPIYHNNCYGDFYSPNVYIWNGTKPQNIELRLLNKEIRLNMFDGSAHVITWVEQGEPKKSTKFYKTAKECTENNHIEVYVFG